MGGCPFHVPDKGVSFTQLARDLRERATAPDSPFHEVGLIPCDGVSGTPTSPKVKINSLSSPTIARVWKDTQDWIEQHPDTLGLSTFKDGKLHPLQRQEIEAFLDEHPDLHRMMLTLKNMTQQPFLYFLNKDCGMLDGHPAQDVAKILGDYSELLDNLCMPGHFRGPAHHIGGPLQGSLDLFFSTAFVALSHLHHDACDTSNKNKQHAEAVLSSPEKTAEFLRHSQSALLPFTSNPIFIVSDMHETLFEFPLWSFLPRSSLDYSNPSIPRLQLAPSEAQKFVDTLDTKIRMFNKSHQDDLVEARKSPTYEVTGCPAHDLQPDNTRVTSKLRDWVTDIFVTFVAPRLAKNAAPIVP